MKKQNKSSKHIHPQQANNGKKHGSDGWAIPEGCLRPSYTYAEREEAIKAVAKAKNSKGKMIDPFNYFVALLDGR